LVGEGAGRDDGQADCDDAQRHAQEILTSADDRFIKCAKLHYRMTLLLRVTQASALQLED
jgi:hypothetical protein